MLVPDLLAVEPAPSMVHVHATSSLPEDADPESVTSSGAVPVAGVAVAAAMGATGWLDGVQPARQNAAASMASQGVTDRIRMHQVSTGRPAEGIPRRPCRASGCPRHTRDM